MNCAFSSRTITMMAKPKVTRTTHQKNPPKNLRYPRRSKLPPEFGVNLFLKKSQTIIEEDDKDEDGEHEQDQGPLFWEPEEIEAISSLFQGRIPQKPGKLNRERPLPLPLPHKLRPLGLPTPKHHIKSVSPSVASSRDSISKQVYKNPRFLVSLAREIKCLAPEEDVCLVLDNYVQFLRKGSLSLTIRELGRMNLPDRALQTFCWAQKQPLLCPDDRILGSTVEVLARNHDLKVPFTLDKFAGLASKSVIESMIKGLVKGGSLNLAWKVLMISKEANRILDAGVYAKLILELGKNPDKHVLVVSLLDELGEREEFSLSQQDCTAVMKICIRIGKFKVVESLFRWFKQSGSELSLVMYTTVIHSRFTENKLREAMVLVWEMEGSEFLFDLPAYRVVIKLFVALNDLSRGVRYFSKLKEAGFSPTYDIYRDVMNLYMVFGRLAKCKEVRKEAEAAGFKLDKHTLSQLLQLECATRMHHSRIALTCESDYTMGPLRYSTSTSCLSNLAVTPYRMVL